MPVKINWNGDIIQNRTPENEWSTKGGLFISVKNIKTYFPIPMAYKDLVKIAGTIQVQVRHENRPDILAKEIYGSEDYWWLIYWMNGIIDPFQGPRAGDVLAVADISDIKALLG